MKWRDLSKQQRAFLINYIRPDPGISLFGKAARDVNKRIINNFGDYEAERRNLETAIDAIPADHTEVRQGPIDDLRAAELMAQDGDFVGASAVLRTATQNAAAALARIQNEAQQLLGYVAAFPLPQGVTLAQSDLDKLAAARLRVQNLLGAATPTQADLVAARDAYQTYMDIGMDALRTMGDVAAADTLVQNAWVAHGTYVQAMGNADYSDLAGTTQHNALNTLVNDAMNLEANYLGRRPQDWEEARNIAAALNAFGAARADHDALKDAAIAELAAAQRTVFDAFAPAIRTGANVDLTRYPNGPDLAGMTTLKGDLQTDIAHIEGTLGGTDIAALTALTAYIPQASRRAIDMQAKVKEAELQLLREQMTAEHGRPAHIEAILTLKDTNPDAGQAVLDGIAANAAKLNGEMANSQFINDRWVELKALENTLAQQDRDATAIYDRGEARRTNDIEPRKAELAGLSKKWFPSKTEKARIRQLETELSQLLQQQRADAAQLNAKNGQITATQTQIAAKEEVIKAGEDQRALFDAITFGPLSPNATPPLPPVKVKEMIELFAKAPDVATRTCKLAANAQDVAALVDTALFLGDHASANFAYQPPTPPGGTAPAQVSLTPEESKAYANSLLERTAYLGAQFATDAQTAITNGVHTTPNPVVDPNADKKANIAARAGQAANAMMQPGPGGTVTLDVNSPAFTEMLTMQKFSVSGTVAPSTMQTKEIEKFQALLSDQTPDPVTGLTNKQRAEAVLNNVAVPADANARKLLTKSLGIPDADFDDTDPAKVAELEQKMRVAILKSMVTPVAQANVGSCFATAGLLNLKAQDPLRVMEMYGELANSGTFTPQVGAAVPAVVNLPDGDDPLSRSLEYSIASASARLDESNEKYKAYYKVIGPVAAVGAAPPGPPPFDHITGAITGTTNAARLQTHLNTAFNANLSFEYDPTVDASVGADGSSDQGIMRMLDARTNQPIETEAQFAAFMQDMIDECFATGDPQLDATDQANLRAAAGGPGFLGAVGGRTDYTPPWGKESGGLGQQTAVALYGTPGTTHATATDLAAPVTGADSTARSKDVLKGIATHAAGGKLSMIGTYGMHSFNALPHTAEMQALMANPPGIDTNIDTILIGPGQDLRDDPITPLEKTIHLFEVEMQRVIDTMPTPEIADMVRVNMMNRPANPMTPQQLNTHIEQQMVNAHAAIGQRDADKWRDEEIAKGNPAPNNVRMQQVKTFFENQSKLAQEGAMAASMIEDLNAPTVAIADSNWGDENDHQNFVIAPNPITGELQMWSQSVLTGKLTPMGDEWLDAKWQKED